MRASFTVFGLRSDAVVAVASCSAGKRRGVGHPSWRLIEEAIDTFSKIGTLEEHGRL